MKREWFNRMGVLVIACLLLCTSGYAQKRRGERVHALKVAFITDKTNLTSSQAEKFWPVYNSYEDDLRNVRQKYVRQYKSKTKAFSEEDARRYVEDDLDYQADLINLKRRYKNEFLKVISAQQLADLYIAEREFRQMLIQKLRQRRNMR